VADQDAHCVVCQKGQESRTGGTHVCEACGDPNYVSVKCGRCGDRTLLDLSDATSLQPFVETRLRAGSVLKVPFCSRCRQGTEGSMPFKAEHYQIKDT
jgi:hypothetical protein